MRSTPARRLPSSASRVPYSPRERELGSSTPTTIDCRARKAINERDRAYPANDMVAHVHDRMPVIIPPDAHDRRLTNIEPDPRDLLVPYPFELMTMWPISLRVNKSGISARRASGRRVALPALPEGGPQRLQSRPLR
jgi:hypothetical protein